MSYRRGRISRRRSAGRMALSGRARGRVVRGYTRRSGMYINRFQAPSKKAEMKFFDVLFGNASGATATAQALPIQCSVNQPKNLVTSNLINEFTNASIGHLLEIPQGAGASDRIGRKIFLRTMEVIGRIELPPLSGATADISNEETHHLWVVVDRQVNGQLSDQVGQLFQQEPATGTGFTYPSSFHNIANNSRFRVVKHVVTKLTRPTLISQTNMSGNAYDMRLFLKLGLTIEYSNLLATGAIGTLRDTGLFMISCVEPGAKPQTATTSPIVPSGVTGAFERYHIRFRYTDV